MIRLCAVGCLNKTAVRGKIVICRSTYGDEAALAEGAIGSIKLDIGVSAAVPFPTTALSDKDLNIAASYFTKTK